MALLKVLIWTASLLAGYVLCDYYGEKRGGIAVMILGAIISVII